MVGGESERCSSVGKVIRSAIAESNNATTMKAAIITKLTILAIVKTNIEGYRLE